jgi:hypothetical protein
MCRYPGSEIGLYRSLDRRNSSKEKRNYCWPQKGFVLGKCEEIKQGETKAWQVTSGW